MARSGCKLLGVAALLEVGKRVLMARLCYTHLCDHVNYALKTKIEITKTSITSLAIHRENTGRLTAPGADAPRTVLPIRNWGIM